MSLGSALHSTPTKAALIAERNGLLRAAEPTSHSARPYEDHCLLFPSCAYVQH